MILARDVLAYVADAANVSITDLTGPSHRKPYTHVRFVIVWLIRQRCPHMSYPAIGRLLGNRDHTTIIHAERRAHEVMAKYPRLNEIAAAAMVHFGDTEIDGLERQIELATAQLAALKRKREIRIRAQPDGVLGRAA